MPYPVLPPQPPAIISHQPSVSSQQPVVDKTALTQHDLLLNNTNKSIALTGHENIAATPVATSPPEKEPLPDPSSTAKNAAALGSALVVEVENQAVQELPTSIDRTAIVDFVDMVMTSPPTPLLQGEGSNRSITPLQAGVQTLAKDFLQGEESNRSITPLQAGVQTLAKDFLQGEESNRSITPLQAGVQTLAKDFLQGEESNRSITPLQAGVQTLAKDFLQGEESNRSITPPFPGREGGSGGLGLSSFGLKADRTASSEDDEELTYSTRRESELVQRPLVPEDPEIESELLPQGHISRTIAPIEVRPQNQRQPAPSRQQQPPSSQTQVNPPTIAGVVELSADRQEYDTIREIFTGEGNALMRYQGGVISADRVQGNLVNRIAVAEGRVGLRRGQQLFRGQRLVYNLLQDSGNITNASGEAFLLTSGTDLSFDLPQTGVVPPIAAERPLSDRLLVSQPSQVTNPGALNILFGGTRPDSGLPAFGQGGQINRVRFEAENIDFYPRGWTASNVRLTNDPYSPPELEIRADRAVFTRVTPLRDEVVLTRPRLVFDQSFSLPILRSRYVFDRSPSEPPIVEFGYDAGERGGLFIQRSFDVYRSSQVRFRVTPQFFLQRAVSQGFDNPAELFGLRARFNAVLGPRTLVGAQAVVNNFDLDGIEEKIRASMRLTQIIGTRFPHRLTLEYSFRDRLFNGSLGYQTVQQSLGGVLTSPVIPIAKTGVNLTYQVGAQLINADTDRLELLSPIRTNDRTNLGRFQTSVSVFRGIRLWRGRPLPATPQEGLRYTPTPVVPNIQLVPLLNGTTSLYTNGQTQNTFTASVALIGQFGHFSRPFLDYTGFNLRLTRVFINGESPFYFDRVVDQRVLAFGITQQIYGPIRVGFQTSINLDTNKSISTDYFVEYSRRTYGITLRYNPDLQLGAILFRVSDFNWNNTGEPFGGSGVRFVDFGILQDY